MDQQPLKIGFAVVRFFPHGGMQRTFLRMINEAVSRGHEVVVFASSWDGPHPRGASLQILPVSARTNHGINAAFAREVGANRSRAELDLLVGFNKLPGLDVYYAGDPCFVARCHEEGRSWLTLQLPRYRAYKRLEAACFGRDSQTESLLIAHGEAEKFRKHHGTHESRLHILPPGIDRDRLGSNLTCDQRRDLRLELGAGDADHLLVTVGSGYRTKGIDRTIRALADLHPELRRRTRFAVVGQGDALPMKQLAQAKGVAEHVVFCGARDDVGPVLRAADLLVHPARVENTGSTLLEAMICGTPVLCSGNCGFATHVEQAGSGWVLATPFEQKDLVQTLSHVLSGEERAGRGARGQQYADNTDLYSLISGGVDVIEEIGHRLRGHPSRS